MVMPPGPVPSRLTAMHRGSVHRARCRGSGKYPRHTVDGKGPHGMAD